MARKGASFHRLVEHLERTFESSRNVTIESPKYVVDKVTGEPREHDIVLTYDQQIRIFVVAIECRDRSRPVGSPEIEAFQNKCNDTGIDKGIIVSSRGFTSPALKKAERYNIDCLHLDQVEKMSRIVSDGFHLNISHIDNCGFYVETMNPAKEPIRLFAITSDGASKEIDVNNPGGFAREIWDQMPESVFTMEGGIWSDDHGVVNHQFLNPEDYYVMDAEGTVQILTAFTLQIFYRIEGMLLPYTYHEYKTGDDKLLYETATTDIVQVGNKSFRGIMSLRENDLRVGMISQADLTEIA